MKIQLILLSAFLINHIKGEPRVNQTPGASLANNDLPIIPTHEVNEDFAPILQNIIPLNKPSKTIVLKDENEPIMEDQSRQTIESMMNAVESSFANDFQSSKLDTSLANQNQTGLSEIPELIYSIPEREMSIVDEPQIKKLIQREYKLPITTRIISRELIRDSKNGNSGADSEYDSDYGSDNNALNYDNKANRLQWRSPIPFMHDNCLHAIQERDEWKGEKSFARKLSLRHMKARKHSRKYSPPSIMRLLEGEPIMFRSMHLRAKETNDYQNGESFPKPTIVMAMMRRTINPKPEMQSLSASDGIAPNISPPISLLSSLFPHLSQRRPQSEELPFSGFFKALSQIVSGVQQRSAQLKRNKLASNEEKREKEKMAINFNLYFS